MLVPVCYASAVVLVAMAVMARPGAGGADLGFSPASAIVLPGVATEAAGVAAEQAYITARFPAWTRMTRTLVSQDNRVLERVKLVWGRQKRMLYFDITGWVGKS